jgi:hypothetical protein
MIVSKYSLFVDPSKSPIDAYIKTKDKAYVDNEWRTAADIIEAVDYIKSSGMPNVISLTGQPELLLNYCKDIGIEITSKILIHG